MPLDWASLQNNIGITLVSLAERETRRRKPRRSADGLRSGARSLRPRLARRSSGPWCRTIWATRWSRSAPTATIPRSMTRRQAPSAPRLRCEHASICRTPGPPRRLNLGNALSNATRFDLGTDRLEEAVAAYRDALTVFKRQDFPLDWASVQNNLGSVYQTLGQRTERRGAAGGFGQRLPRRPQGLQAQRLPARLGHDALQSRQHAAAARAR